MKKEAKIKVSEVFYSVQGEGRYVGAPSVFMRTFGCNFECRGFGLPEGQRSNEPELIAARLDEIKPKTMNDLPLAKTGCDSYSSWHKDYKQLSPFYTVSEMVEMLVDATPNKSFKGIHLVVTGGEPLLGWQRVYPELFEILMRDHGLRNVTFETNGTQKLIKNFKNWLVDQPHRLIMENRVHLDVHFSVSAKLPVSGEAWHNAIRPEIVSTYRAVGHATDLKFVVDPSSVDGINYIKRAIKELACPNDNDGNVYLMPVGGMVEEYQANSRAVAQIAMDMGLFYSPRLHCDLFGNNWGT